jgi:hypothetical protein
LVKREKIVTPTMSSRKQLPLGKKKSQGKRDNIIALTMFPNEKGTKW